MHPIYMYVINYNECLYLYPIHVYAAYEYT